MADLDGLLLVRIGRRKDRERGPVAEAGQPVDLAAQQRAPATELARAEILDVEIDHDRRVDDGDLADHLAARPARGAQREPDLVARQVPGQQQVALRVEAVEDLLVGQPA